MEVLLHSQIVPRFSRTETERQKALALVFVNSSVPTENAEIILCQQLRIPSQLWKA